MKACTPQVYNGAFWTESAISLPLVAIFLIALLTYTLHYEYTQRKELKMKRKLLRILYILLQAIGLYWVLIDALRFVVDPHTLILRGNIGCHFFAITPKIAHSLYYGVYLSQILLRLKASFHNSFLEISKRTMIIFKILILIVYTGPITMVILNHGISTCIRGWKTWDFPQWYEQNQFSYCDMSLTFGVKILAVVGPIIIASVNIIFSVTFTMKLNKLLSLKKDNKASHFKFKLLIVKNTILSSIGAISTVLSYILWVSTKIGGVILYIDLVINSLVIGLMFTYNDKYYNKMCKCCIMCFKKFDESKSGVETLQNVSSLSHLETTEKTMTCTLSET